MNVNYHVLYCHLFIKKINRQILKTLTKPSGPILGARDDVAPTSPPTHLKYTVK